MEPSLRKRSPDTSDAKPALRKPANDTSGRRYRRHSPDGASDSSSSDGAPKHVLKKPPSKDFEKNDSERSREDNRESLREHHNRYERDNTSYRKSNSHSYGYHRHGGHIRNEKDADGEHRMQHRSSLHGQDTKGDDHINYSRKETNFHRAGENWRDRDRYTRDKYDNSGHRSKDKEREAAVSENQRHYRNDPLLDKSLAKTGQGDRGACSDRRDRSRSPDDYKSNSAYSYRGSRGHDKFSGFDRSKESDKNGKEEFDGQEDSIRRQNCTKDFDIQKDKCDIDVENEAPNGRSLSSCERSTKKPKTGFSDNSADEAPPDKFEDEKSYHSSKPVQEAPSRNSHDPVNSSTSQSGAAADVSSAKVAAMKAAELVNKNLTVGGIMSTDHKKKLLWGNKKNTAAEESSHRWDLPLFSDKERQEKFNKLMGVKGDVNLETNKGGAGGLQSEKQEQLEMDLEKQYTAGLRRRDGRTVGLGL